MKVLVLLAVLVVAAQALPTSRQDFSKVDFRNALKRMISGKVSRQVATHAVAHDGIKIYLQKEMREPDSSTYSIELWKPGGMVYSVSRYDDGETLYQFGDSPITLNTVDGQPIMNGDTYNVRVCRADGTVNSNTPVTSPHTGLRCWLRLCQVTAGTGGPISMYDFCSRPGGSA